MNYTPGPWAIVRHDMGDENIMFLPTGIKGADGKAIISFDGGLCPEDFEGDVAVIRANASLIAAAPDMLAMLEEIREWAYRWSEIRTVEQLDKVIRKARGEE